MKILVIRFSSIGDIVLTTPIIRGIKKQVKEAEVHFITKKQFVNILESNPYISKVHSIEKNISEISMELKKEKFDFIVDLHHNLRSTQLKYLLGKRSKAFRKLNFEKWLAVNFGIQKFPKTHIVDRYFETVESLGVINDGKGLDYFIPANDEVDIKTLPIAFQNGYIGFVIGAKHFTKQLPNEKIASIIQKINQPIILLGGKEDTIKANQVISALPPPSSKQLFNACGKYNLNQSASLVKQARKIITHDTGLMHIAAALKKEIVSVWGNTIPEFGMSPYYGELLIASHISQVQNLSCRPCSKLGHIKCPKGHFMCMNQIKMDEIVKFIGT
jgi:ADP-heptose:LPS heptosyltransferase